MTREEKDERKSLAGRAKYYGYYLGNIITRIVLLGDNGESYRGPDHTKPVSRPLNLQYKKTKSGRILVAR